MIVRAELSCLTCGYEVGDVEGPRGGRLEDMVFLPVHQGDQLIVDHTGRFRCPRCKSGIVPQGVAPVSHPIDPDSIFEADITQSQGRWP